MSNKHRIYFSVSLNTILFSFDLEEGKHEDLFDSKSTLRLLQTHGCLQVPECGFSAIHNVHGLFKMPERVSQR